MKPRRALLEADIRFANTAAGLDETGAVRMLAISDLYDQMGKSCRRPYSSEHFLTAGLFAMNFWLPEPKCRYSISWRCPEMN
jgi:hypothetical protein